MDVFRDVLKKAARTLEANLRTFGGMGSPGDLRSTGVVTAQQLGDWDASRQLGATVDAANREIITGYENFLAQYQAVIDALHRTAAMYEQAEQDSDARLRAMRPDQPDVRSVDW